MYSFKMFLVLAIFLISSSNCENFDYPIGGYERADPINPQLIFPCLAPIYDPEYGRFDPVIYVDFKVTLPPIAGCPEIVNKKTVRFFAISKKNPTVITSVSNIEPGSKVSIYLHGFNEEYDFLNGLTVALSTLRTNDWVVLVDWARLANSRAVGNVRIPYINIFLSGVNTILVGRITCKFVKFLNKNHGIRIEDILIVGHSEGATTTGFIASYCREKYGILFQHITTTELPSIPFRNSNYPLANRTSAKYFEAIFTTKSSNIPVIDEITSAIAHLGYFEVDAHCVYYVNPELLLAEQPPCVILPGPTFCSHDFAQQVFISAYSGRCLYRYGPCPEIILPPSNQEYGLTRLNCPDHPSLGRTCIRTTSFPVKSC
ncbi:phospholipase A1 VesT1.02-like [Brevipalpus obovatus]|uniref:phospholipase A1 VesT1.02-like n=1 Tax=Brevipalpus obovatus TaxID=246614 RepID=UPI003D9F1C24